MKTDFPTVFTPEEVAKLTRTSEQAIIADLEAGRMPGFTIGAEWRILKEGLLAFMAGEPEFHVKGNASMPEGGAADVDWHEADSFVYTWPDRKRETHDPVYEANIELSSGRYSVKIGYTTRKAAGMKDRCRIVVFLTLGSQLIPVVEFAGANDFGETHRVASIIKQKNGHHVPSKSQLPLEYEEFPMGAYSDVVVGPYAARGLAVIVDKDDRCTMLRHALIRAQYKGWLGN